MDSDKTTSPSRKRRTGGRPRRRGVVGPGKPASAAGASGRIVEQMEELYDLHLPRLVSIAAARFQMSEEDVQDLAHEIFLRLVVTDHQIEKFEGWFAVVLFNACRNHLSVRGRRRELTPPPGPDAFDPRPELNGRLLIQEITSHLDDRSRLILRMHFLEGYTSREIATRLGTTPDYVAKLVHLGLQSARKACALLED